jgi:hypothetical protein
MKLKKMRLSRWLAFRSLSCFRKVDMGVSGVPLLCTLCDRRKKSNAKNLFGVPKVRLERHFPRFRRKYKSLNC